MRPTLRTKGWIVLLLGLLMPGACRSPVTLPDSPMPPNTILLSAMMRELSARPGFTEALLGQLEGVKGDTRRGPALLTPTLIEELRKRILGQDWRGLDRFPGWTMREIDPTVRTAGRVLNSKEPQNGSEGQRSAAPELSGAQARAYLDTEPYPLDQAQTVSLDEPSRFAPFTMAGVAMDLGAGVTRGDGPNGLASEHAESQRLANVLNRLAANGAGGAQLFTVSVRGQVVHTPEALIATLVEDGHAVTVNDARYFANFGHLHYQRGQTGRPLDVMMPFWIDTQIAVPDGRSWWHRLLFRPRPLLVPVSHAEYEWHIRAPQGKAGINADISYYFGIDGKSEWRTMDTLDQAWVLKRNAHTYTGEQALEVTRLTGLITVAMLHQHSKRPDLPFGGYYSLGVCQDGVSAIERKLTGKVTLFPNTASSALFDDPRDAEVNSLMQAIPKDRAGAKPEPERVFGSLPAEPGADAEFASISVPGLAEDLRLTYAAWQDGSLQRVHGRFFYWAVSSAAAATCAALIALTLRRIAAARDRR